jgi:DNA-binding response OmpR family regulator
MRMSNKVLVVDDEKDMADIVRLVLTQAGYDVDMAYSGAQCLEKASKTAYDVIMLDIRMPEMDGWTTLRHLKDKKITEKSKVIILTVEKGPGVEIFGLQDVVKDYITKPFNREKLIKRVKKAMQSK